MVVKKVTAVAALGQQRITPCLSLESVDVRYGGVAVDIRLMFLGTSENFSGKGSDVPRAVIAAISDFLKKAGLAEISLTYSTFHRPPKTGGGRWKIRYTTSRGYQGAAIGETVEETVRQMVFYCLRNTLIAEGLPP